MKASATTIKRAKAKGIKLRRKKGNGTRAKTNAELLAQLKKSTGSKKTVAKKTVAKKKKKKATPKIPFWSRKKIHEGARVLGSRGGKAKARNS